MEKRFKIHHAQNFFLHYAQDFFVMHGVFYL